MGAMGRPSLLTVLLIAAGLVADPARAGFRCETELVGRGMTHVEVLERCGAPAFEYGFLDYRYPGIFVRVDEWTYELGSNRFRRLLTFENGRLVRIETRDKPTGSLEAYRPPRPLVLPPAYAW